jgi:hypothetical protein
MNMQQCSTPQLLVGNSQLNGHLLTIGIKVRARHSQDPTYIGTWTFGRCEVYAPVTVNGGRFFGEICPCASKFRYEARKRSSKFAASAKNGIAPSN